jgi:threonyl-tRNA synthetase
MRSGIMVDGGYDALMMYNMQWDVENTERFNIRGNDEPLAIIHGTALTGCARILPLLLGRTLLTPSPVIPIEIGATHVNIVPASGDFGVLAVEVARVLSQAGFRVEVDASDRPVGKRVSKSRNEWVPYVCVVGRAEADGSPSRIRGLASDENLVLDEFISRYSSRLLRFPEDGRSSRSLPFAI